MSATAGTNGHKPPHSLEAESELLGALFIAEGERVGQILSLVSSEDFYMQRHRLIYEAAAVVWERDGAVDIVTVSQAMRDRGTLDRAGGLRSVSEVLDRHGTLEHVEHYAGIVRDKTRLRRLLEAAQGLEAMARGDVDSVDALVAQVAQRWDGVLTAVKPDAPMLALRTIAARCEDGPNWLEDAPADAKLLLAGPDGAFMRDSRVALIVAPGSTGKTYALVQLALAVACGGMWLGTYAATKGKVLLALGEEDDDEVRRRVWKASRELSQYERSEVARNVVPLGLSGERISFMERGQDGNVATTAWFASLRDSLAANGPWRLIILDPWSRWGGPDAETDAHAATWGISLLEQLTKVPGAPAVMVAHHTRKGVTGARGVMQDASDTRGSSALVDGARLVLNLARRPKSGLLELRVTKANYTLAGGALVLARGNGGVLRPATPAEAQEAEA